MTLRINIGIATSFLTCFLLGCAQGPEPPKPGSPAFLWASARDNYSKGDFLKAQEQLARLTKSENEFTAKARAWNLVLLSGLASGYMELSDTYEIGGRENRNNPTPFRKFTSDYRSTASRYATQFAEDYGKFAKAHKEAEVPLHFLSPGGSPAKNPMLEKVASGKLPAINEADPAQRDIVRRAVLMSACNAAGAPNDAARLAEVLKSETASVKTEIFQRAMAESLYQLSDMYGRKKLGKPDYQKFFLTQSMDALKSVSEDKNCKELKKKIETGLKGL
jgi:hypothetical protein